MTTELVHVGFGNVLAVSRVVAMVSPRYSAPTRRLVQEAKRRGQLADLTSGRKTKAVVIMDTGHIVLVAITPETVAGRVLSVRGGLSPKIATFEEEGD